MKSAATYVGPVETGIPMPVTNRGGSPRSDLGKALRSMKLGESFVTKMNRATVYSLARYYSIRVSVHAEDHGKMMRVWRIQ